MAFYPKAPSKSQIVVQHSKLADRGDVEAKRAYWKAALARLAGEGDVAARYAPPRSHAPELTHCCPREPYLPAAGEDVAQWHSVCYIDAGLTRLERFQTSGASDEYHEFEERTSPDNGRTWTERRSPVRHRCGISTAAAFVTYLPGIFIDRARNRRYQMRMRRIWPGRAGPIPTRGGPTGTPATTTSSPGLATSPKR